VNRALILIGIALANAVRGLWRASTTSLMAIATIAVVLALLGGAWIVVGNMASLLEEFGAELQLTAYLEPGLSEARQNALAEEVSRAPGVAKVAVVTREEALERFARIAGSDELLAGLVENPLPPSLEITLAPEARTEAAVESLAAALDGLEGIDELAHGQDWIEGYGRAIALARGLALGLGAVLGLAALVIVGKTIRLAVYRRRDEHDILALVGATRTLVRVPFLLEGTLQGVLGGCLALAVVFGAYELLRPQIESGLALVIGRAGLAFLTTGQALALVAAGALLGLFGAAAALVGGRGTP